ncbi:hypothetical protein MPTK2_1g10210 [Marchantia polymorpha subsp. ruderalis]
MCTVRSGVTAALDTDCGKKKRECQLGRRNQPEEKSAQKIIDAKTRKKRTIENGGDSDEEERAFGLSRRREKPALLSDGRSCYCIGNRQSALAVHEKRTEQRRLVKERRPEQSRDERWRESREQREQRGHGETRGRHARTHEVSAVERASKPSTKARERGSEGEGGSEGGRAGRTASDRRKRRERGERGWRAPSALPSPPVSSHCPARRTGSLAPPVPPPPARPPARRRCHPPLQSRNRKSETPTPQQPTSPPPGALFWPAGRLSRRRPPGKFSFGAPRQYGLRWTVNSASRALRAILPRRHWRPTGVAMGRLTFDALAGRREAFISVNILYCTVFQSSSLPSSFLHSFQVPARVSDSPSTVTVTASPPVPPSGLLV